MTYALALTALADPTRRAILETLRAAPRTVSEIAADQPVSRPAVSQHLKVLKASGLVSVEARGAARVYSVRPEGLAELRRYLDEFWSEALGAFAAEIEPAEERKR